MATASPNAPVAALIPTASPVLPPARGLLLEDELLVVGTKLPPELVVVLVVLVLVLVPVLALVPVLPPLSCE